MVSLTGLFLMFFYVPSTAPVIYDGSFRPLNGVEMSLALQSTLDLSFDVRGGLLVRQIHNWGSSLMVAALLLLIARIFFTGAFRRPRGLSWSCCSSCSCCRWRPASPGWSCPTTCCRAPAW